jgi:hypothetical protein
VVCSEENDQGSVLFCLASSWVTAQGRCRRGSRTAGTRGAGGSQGGRMQQASSVSTPLATVTCVARKSRGGGTLVVAHGLRREPRPEGGAEQGGDAGAHRG